MFRKIKIRLTLLNSLIFLIVLSLISIVLYFYFYYLVNTSVRDSLLKEYEKYRPRIVMSQFNYFGEVTDRKLRIDKFSENPQITVALWDKYFELQDTTSQFIYFNKEYFSPKKINEIEEIKVSNHSFHSYSVEIPLSSTESIILQFVQNTNSEKMLLNKVRFLLIVVNIASVAVIYLVGWFLSGQALVPIKEAWSKQQQFVSDASHELRTPLTTIQVRSDLLLQNPGATIEEKVSDISVISNETRRLSKLVNQLLTLARSDSNQEEIVKEEFRLDELILKITNDQFRDIVELQGKQMECTIDEKLLFYGDKEKLCQLIIILLDNALKFTGGGGVIKIKAWNQGNKVVLICEDNGIGMETEEIGKIFDRFYQVSSSRTDHNGTGLGLSIAKWIIDKHDGKIKVISQIGSGTTFNIALPHAKAEKK